MPEIPNNVPSRSELWRRLESARKQAAAEKQVRQQINSKANRGYASSLSNQPKVRQASAGGTATKSPKVGTTAPGAPKVGFKSALQRLPLKITPRGGGTLALFIGAGLLAIHNLKAAYKLYKLSQKEPKFVFGKPNPPPFTGGQTNGTVYNVTTSVTDQDGRSVEAQAFMYGPIGGARLLHQPQLGDIWSIEIQSRGLAEAPNQTFPIKEFGWHGNGGGGAALRTISILRVERKDGQPDTGGDLPGYSTATSSGKKEGLARTTIPGRSLMPADNVGWGRYLKARPGEGLARDQQNKRQPVAIQIPPNTPVRFSFDPSVKIPPFTFQAETPATVSVAPAKTNPATGKTETPITVKALGSEPINLIAAGNAPVILNIPGQQPITINPDGTSKPTGLTQSLSDPIRAFVPTPVRPTTPTSPGITPIEPTTPTTPEIPQLPNFKDRDLQEIGLTLVGITSLLKGLQNNTSTSALENAAAAGTCRTTQPGGCTSKAINDAVQKGNKDLANTLNNVANVDQTVLLRVIDAKLGPQISGGIGPKLKNFVDWAVVDRTINLVTMVATLHNVFMLTNSIQNTFFEAVDNVLAIPSLINNPDADTVDSKQAVTGYIDKYFAQLFGVGEWAALKSQWKAYSTIYSSTAQTFDNLREIHNDSQELMNMARNNTSELGNALVEEGVISEDNWEYKDPNQKVKSKGFNKLQRIADGLETVENSLEALEQVTAQLRNITETANEIKENISAVDKAVKDANTAAKQDRDAKVEGLELPNFNLDDLF